MLWRRTFVTCKINLKDLLYMQNKVVYTCAQDLFQNWILSKRIKKQTHKQTKIF